MACEGCNNTRAWMQCQECNRRLCSVCMDYSEVVCLECTKILLSDRRAELMETLGGHDNDDNEAKPNCSS